MEQDVKESYIVSSLVRGFQILSTFTTNHPARKVSEIAELTGLDQTTVYRFVYTLEKMGYLVRDEETKRYRQSVRMLTLSLPAQSGTVVRDVALPVMYELSKEVNEIVTLEVLDGVEIVTLATAEIPEKIVFSTPIGHRQPAFCTAAGKVLLASQPVETWDRLLSRIEFVHYTEKSIIDPKLLREELLLTHRQGYAAQDGERLINLGSLAAPIMDYQNDVIAAINISSLSVQLFHAERVDFYVSKLLNSARIISKQMGYLP